MVWGAICYDSRSTLVVMSHILIANMYFRLMIQPVLLPLINSIQGGAFQSAVPYRCCNPTCCTENRRVALAFKITKSFSNRVRIGHHWTAAPVSSVTNINRPSIGRLSATSIELHPISWHSVPVWHNTCTFAWFHSSFWRLHRLLKYHYFIFERTFLEPTLTCDLETLIN